MTFEVEPGLELIAVKLRVESARPALVVVGQGSGPPGQENSDQASPPRAPAIAVDPRGMGYTAPKHEAGQRSPFGGDWKEAYLALYLNRPLLGQRVADLLDMLAGLDAVGPNGDHAGFHVVGVGAAGPVVLHAALLDERGLIKQVTLERSLASWADVVEKGISRDQLGNVVPGVLREYDLPELAARLAPLPLAIASPVDAKGEPVSRDRIQEDYARAVTAYGPGGALEFRDRP